MGLKQLPEIYYTAMHATVAASNVILPIYQEEVEPSIKSDGSPVTKADLAASSVIAEALRTTNIPILGEELEKQDYAIRSQWEQNWCVDPLDGTKMFLLKNDEFSVNIAHVIKGKSVFGIICSPVDQKIIIGGPEYGAFILSFEDIDQPENWEKLSPHTAINSPLVITCSRSFFDDQETHLKETVDLPSSKLSYLRKGSALKFFDLAIGNADIYPRFAPTMEWDIAAGQAILETLGGSITDIRTQQPLTYNKESLYNPHFIAKTKALLS